MSEEASGMSNREVESLSTSCEERSIPAAIELPSASPEEAMESERAGFGLASSGVSVGEANEFSQASEGGHLPEVLPVLGSENLKGFTKSKTRSSVWTIEEIVMETKSKLQSFSAPESVTEPNSTLRTCCKSVPKPNVSHRIPRTPFSLGAITPIVGTLKSVSLSDWWLTKKTNEKVLGVAGFESKGGSEVRLFSSGAISKRHDSSTLETLDGIKVCISGFINQSRTLQNGISPEVCNRFLLGFPYNWNDYGEEESVKKKKNFSISFDDIPVSRLHDLLLTSSLCLKSEILDDVVNRLRGFACPGTEKSRMDFDNAEEKESVVPRVVGVKTRGMLRRREDNETSIAKNINTASKKKRSR